MKIYVDTASLDEIKEWDVHPWVSGFTTNPTLARLYVETTEVYPPKGPHGFWGWAKELVSLTDKPVSIDGPPEVWNLRENVYRKVTSSDMPPGPCQVNLTAVCSVRQTRVQWLKPDDIISVFAGRIMDTGRDPIAVIDAAKKTGAQVLWASVREPYNIVMAEDAGCDIVTVPPAILKKYLAWHGKPLETVAQETIRQFERDAEGLWC